MAKIAIWCRHEGDNIIGIGKDIPWDVASDVAKFVRIVTGQDVIMGRKTYESLPEKKIPADKIFILTTHNELEVFDKAKHFIASDVRDFKDYEEDLYIAGGAQVYEKFICGSNRFRPDVIIDCIYHGELLSGLDGEKAEVSSCLEAMKRHYTKIWGDFECDGVTTDIYVKKGEFVDKELLRSLIADITQEA